MVSSVDFTAADITGEGNPDADCPAIHRGCPLLFPNPDLRCGLIPDPGPHNPHIQSPGVPVNWWIFPGMECQNFLPAMIHLVTLSVPLPDPPCQKCSYSISPEGALSRHLPPHPEQYADAIVRDCLTAENASQNSSPEEVRCAVLHLVLDYLYSGQQEEGWAALEQYLPSMTWMISDRKLNPF